MNEPFTTLPDTFSVRRFEPRDREAVLALARTDRMQSQPAEALMSSIEGAIAGDHPAWVAEAFGRIIGSATIIPNDDSLAHLRCLCVLPDFAERREVSRRLAERAIRDAWEHGYLKLVVHTKSPPSEPAAFLHDLGFEFSRERSLDGEHVLEFYLNLYLRPLEGKVMDGANRTARWPH